MQIGFNVAGEERKALVNAIAEITGATAVYKGVPSCNYEVDYFTIDRNGMLSFDDRADSEEIENLLDRLSQKGLTAEGAEQMEEGTTENENVELTVSMPRDYFTESALENLKVLIEAKGKLIKKALGVADLPLEITDEKVSFPWFSFVGQDSDAVKAYEHLTHALCEMAKKQKRVTAREKEVENEKYAFRCFLLRLGFIGDEYKAERKVLLKNMTGSAAFKGGAKDEVSE